jgi:hypothetical protein
LMIPKKTETPALNEHHEIVNFFGGSPMAISRCVGAVGQGDVERREV